MPAPGTGPSIRQLENSKLAATQKMLGDGN